MILPVDLGTFVGGGLGDRQIDYHRNFRFDYLCADFSYCFYSYAY